MWFLLIVLFPLILLAFMELKYFRIKRILNRLPGPPTLPVVGNAHQFGKTLNEILDTQMYWWNEFGKKNYRVWIGYIPTVTVTDVKDIEFILTNSTLQQKSDAYDMLHPWLGDGLFTSFGTKWQKQRRMINPAFSYKILQNYHEVMNKNTIKFIDKLQKAAKGEVIIDFQELAHYYTLDVICETAMGVSTNVMDDDNTKLSNAFKEIFYIMNMRAFHPFKRNNFLFRLSPDYNNFKKTLQILQDFADDVIEKRMKARENELKNPEAVNADDDDAFTQRRKMAFLDTLLTTTFEGRPLTKAEIHEEVSTFMAAGHDTTTSGISFAVYLLSRHPHIQQKVYEEQQRVMGSDLKRDATFQEIAEMKYLDLVLKEAQRLYPSAPIIGRRADRDYDMNGTLIPKGTTVSLFLMAMGYNDSVFSDPYVCRPERFDLNECTEKPNQFSSVPFSAGPRNCIGQKFSMMEMKTVISLITRTFEILPPVDELIKSDGSVQHYLGMSKEEQQQAYPNPSKYDPVLSTVMTLKSENGILIRLRERK